MRLTVLVDNNTFIDQYFIGEPAVSYYVEADGKKILFDVGYSDAFILNAEKMDINLADIDFIVLSHGHLDHTWGLPHLMKYISDAGKPETLKNKPLLIAHPALFTSRKYKSQKELGPNTSQEKLSTFFEVRLSEKPVYLTENIVFLGEIPRKNEFEAKKPIGEIRTADGFVPDFLLDDSALVYRSSNGLVIVTGCSHSGICNITEYGREILKEKRVLDIIGGFHLLNPSTDQLNGTKNYLEELSPSAIHACHCTDLKSKISLAGVTNLHEVGIGLVLNY